MSLSHIALVAPPKAFERAGTGKSKKLNVLVPPICACETKVQKIKRYKKPFFNAQITQYYLLLLCFTLFDLKICIYFISEVGLAKFLVPVISNLIEPTNNLA